MVNTPNQRGSVYFVKGDLVHCEYGRSTGVRAIFRLIKQSEGRFSFWQNARTPKKQRWMSTIRLQRQFLKELKDRKLITTGTYRELYMKSKGGFFRSRRHLKIYMNERNMVQKNG
jgi:ribosomal protein L19E